MAKKIISKKIAGKVVKGHARSTGKSAMLEKASKTGKFAAELSPKVKPPKTNK